jgi:hypothetical protein
VQSGEGQTTLPNLLIRNILHTVSRTDIYCSNDKVGTVHLSIIPPSTSMHFAARVEGMACCSSVQCVVQYCKMKSLDLGSG